MANVTVDYAQLQTTASQLQTGKQNVEQELTRLQNLITNLVQSGFRTDQASGKFQMSYEQWTTGARNVMQGLEGMRSFLQAVVDQHTTLDNTLSHQTGS